MEHIGDSHSRLSLRLKISDSSRKWLPYPDGPFGAVTVNSI